MPEDQVSQDVTEDAPLESTDAGGSDQGAPAEPADTNWEDRYRNLEADHTRAAQEAAQFRQVIDLARQGDPEALDWLGLEAVDDEQDDLTDELDDPEDQMRAELDQIKGHLAQQAELAQEQELAQLEEEYLIQSLSELESQHGQLSDQEQEAILNLAFSYETDDGLPDVAGAYQAFSEASKAAQERYIESKKAPNVEAGAAGLEKVNLSDPTERLKAAVDMADAMMHED